MDEDLEEVGRCRERGPHSGSSGCFKGSDMRMSFGNTRDKKIPTFLLSILRKAFLPSRPISCWLKPSTFSDVQNNVGGGISRPESLSSKPMEAFGQQDGSAEMVMIYKGVVRV